MTPAIVLVDDEAMVLTVLKRALAALASDCDLIAVVNGAAALVLLAERPVALLITDMRLPDMDGIALTEAIKLVAPHCPVILMTGYPSPEIEQRAVAVGVDFFLAKPFRINQLAAMVRAALAQDGPSAGATRPAEPTGCLPL
jgi:DNA-binding NtrC family response regulator